MANQDAAAGDSHAHHLVLCDEHADDAGCSKRSAGREELVLIDIFADYLLEIGEINVVVHTLILFAGRLQVQGYLWLMG